MEQFQCLTNLSRSVYHYAVLREKLQDDDKEYGRKRQNEASGLKLYDLCFMAYILYNNSPNTPACDWINNL